MSQSNIACPKGHSMSYLRASFYHCPECHLVYQLYADGRKIPVPSRDPKKRTPSFLNLTLSNTDDGPLFRASGDLGSDQEVYDRQKKLRVGPTDRFR